MKDSGGSGGNDAVSESAGDENHACSRTVDRSEGFFKALVESRSGVMLLFGRDGAMHYASPSVGSVLGMGQERILGVSVAEVLDPGGLSRVGEVISGGTRYVSGDFRLRREDGSWVVIRGSVQGFLDDRNVDGVVLVGRELDQSAQDSLDLENYSLYYHTVFDDSPVGMARVGADGRWLRVNRTLCEILGYEREELLGRSFQEITHSDDLAPDAQRMRDFLSGARSSASVEKRFVRKDFSSVWVSITAQLLRDDADRPLYFACVVQDIFKEKEARQVYASLNERELDILHMLADGLTNLQIATRLNLSLSSAKVYVRRVTEKLDATNRTQAAVRAAKLGLL